MRTWRRMIRPAIVWTLVLLMTIDTAVACRLFARRSCCRKCCIPCHVCVVETPCGTSSAPLTSTDGAGPDTTILSPSLTKPAEEPAAVEDLFGEPGAPQEPAAAPIAEQDPADAEPVADEAEDIIDDTPVPEAPDTSDLLGTPEPKPADAAEDLFDTPEPEAPDTSDLFGTPESKPSDEAEDFFDTPAPEAPDTSAAEDGLFGTPEPPAADAVEDLLDKPAPEAADTTSAADDLFGTPEPKPADAVEDLLDTPEPEAPDTTSATDDLFGTPEPKPADAVENLLDMPEPEAPDTSSAEENLFGTPVDESDLVDSTRPTADDLGGFSSRLLRTFVDNTGDYRCQGRLVAVWGDQVQLLKENGRTATFPLRRLSASDRAFVEGQLAIHPDRSAVRTAASGQ